MVTSFSQLLARRYNGHGGADRRPAFLFTDCSLDREGRAGRLQTLVYRRSSGSVSGNMTTLQWVDATAARARPVWRESGDDLSPYCPPPCFS